MSAKKDPLEDLTPDLIEYLESKQIRVISFLAKGEYSYVYKATKHSGGDPLAVKVMKLKEQPKDTIFDENKIVSTMITAKVKSEFILKFHNIWELREYTIIVSDFADEGDLMSIIDRDNEPIEEVLIKSWFTQIVRAIEYLTDINIAHRDIKPDNILIHKKTAKLTDFGYSKIFSNTDVTTKDFCGTFIYQSPEQINCQLENKAYDPFQSDVYSLGVLFFLLLEKEFPYFKRNKNVWNRQLLKLFLKKQTKEDWKMKGIYSNNNKIYSLLKQLLNPKVESRITCYQILSHPWFREHNHQTNQRT